MYEFDAFRVDPVRRLLLRDGEPVPVTPKALSILLILLERAGEVVEKSELIERIWQGAFVTEANLTQNVFSLRKCLGERANDNRYIVTVPGQGYTFAGEVRPLERSATAEIPIVVIAEPAAPSATSAGAGPVPAAAADADTPRALRRRPRRRPARWPWRRPAPARSARAPAAPLRWRWLAGWSAAGVLLLLLAAWRCTSSSHLGRPASRGRRTRRRRARPSPCSTSRASRRAPTRAGSRPPSPRC